MKRSIGRIASVLLTLLMLSLALAACGSSDTATPTTGSGQTTSTQAPQTNEGTTATQAPQATEATQGGTATDLGTESNPIKMYFVPSAEVDKVLTSGNKIAEGLEKLTGLKFETAVPTNYAAVIEAMGSDEADIAWLATFAYVLAHDKYGAEVALTTVRNGEETYKGEILARADSGINTIEDCNGKAVAWTDAASTSGYVYPSALFAQKGIKPSQEIFAGGHPQAVLALYEGNVDCAATFYSPEHDGKIQDGRSRILETHPDVAEKIKIIGYTADIPNDTVTFRKDFPAELKTQIVDALLQYAESEEGKAALDELYSIDGLVKSEDSRYDIVRQSLQDLGKNPEDFLK